MRCAVKFERRDEGAYIAHLDIQRAVMRALRRSGLELEFSEGFNPHILLSFAIAAPVGLKSEGELFEFKLKDDISEKEIFERIKKVFPECIAPVDAKIMKEDAKKLMAIVAGARYSLIMDEKSAAVLADYIAKDEVNINITKNGQTKTSEVSQMILSSEVKPYGMEMLVKCGSNGNLNPAFLLRTVFGEKKAAEFEIIRKELYTVAEGNMVPLFDVV